MNKINDFGINPIGIYEKALPADLAWEDRLLEAGKAGYDFVEMSIDESDERLSRLDWDHSTRKDLKRSIEKTGVPILTIGLSGHRKFPMGSSSKKLRQQGLDMLHKTIELAHDLDAWIIQLMGYDVFYEKSDQGTSERFLEGLIQGASWASAAGVMLGLENVDVDTVNSIDKALQFVQKVNSPWLNLYPDMGNLVASGYDPVKQLRLAEKYLIGIHVKDALPGEYRGVIFEKGDVPFNNVFQTLSEIGYSGPMAVEMWSHLDTTGDPLRSINTARNFVDYLIKANKKI